MSPDVTVSSEHIPFYFFSFSMFYCLFHAVHKADLCQLLSTRYNSLLFPIALYHIINIPVTFAVECCYTDTPVCAFRRQTGVPTGVRDVGGRIAGGEGPGLVLGRAGRRGRSRGHRRQASRRSGWIASESGHRRRRVRALGQRLLCQLPRRRVT